LILFLIYSNKNFIYCQSSEFIAYQAVLRDASGRTMDNVTVNLTLSIIKDSATGKIVYSEIHNSATNNAGMFRLDIGSENINGFDSIDWADGPFFIKIEVDGTEMGTSQLLSVPYALYSKKTKMDGFIKSAGMIPENYSETVKDIEGNVYKAVTIGSQTWMSENLRTSKYNDGTPIRLITEPITWSGSSEPAYCWYGYTEANAYSSVVAGALYNWYTVNTGNLCPVGWHVPTDAEWTIMTEYLGGLNNAGAKLKENGTKHWTSPNAGATNETGFKALPCGIINSTGSFFLIGIAGLWWSSGENSADDAWIRSIANNESKINVSLFLKRGGCSVRCLKN
jgi:uncharacterized protein (TIGR02145 family)